MVIERAARARAVLLTQDIFTVVAQHCCFYVRLWAERRLEGGIRVVEGPCAVAIGHHDVWCRRVTAAVAGRAVDGLLGAGSGRRAALHRDCPQVSKWLRARDDACRGRVQDARVRVIPIAAVHYGRTKGRYRRARRARPHAQRVVVAACAQDCWRQNLFCRAQPRATASTRADRCCLLVGRRGETGSNADKAAVVVVAELAVAFAYGPSADVFAALHGERNVLDDLQLVGGRAIFLPRHGCRRRIGLAKRKWVTIPPTAARSAAEDHHPSVRHGGRRWRRRPGRRGGADQEHDG